LIKIYSKNSHLKFIELSFIILPLALISGPFLPDFIIVTSSIIFIHYCFKYYNFHLFKNKFFYLFLIYYFYISINSVFNNPNFDSIKISFSFVRFGVYTVAIIYLITCNEKILKNFFYVLFFCITILIFDGFFQYYFSYNIFGKPLVEAHRVSSFFGDELILGSYISRFFPILFGLFILLKNEIKINNSLIIIVFILAEVLVFLSGERTSFLFINLAAIYSLIMLKQFRKIRAISLISSIFILVLISFASNNVKSRIINHTLDQTRILNSGKLKVALNDNDQGIYIFSKQHTHHYITSIRMFVENKYFGVGVKNFRNFCNKHDYSVSNLSCSTHPHNTYLQILSELGLIGFLFILSFFLTFCYYSFIHILSKFKKTQFFSSFQICMLSGILIILWPIAPSGNFFNNWLIIISMIPVILFIWAIKLNK